MVVLGAGTGVLPLMTAAAGASSVMAVERTRMLYRMARQVQLHECTPQSVCSLQLACQAVTVIVAIETCGCLPPGVGGQCGGPKCRPCSPG